MQSVTIYALVDPQELDLVRYVGKAINPRARLSGHCHNEHPHTPKGKWITALLAQGVQPMMVILDTARPEFATQAEMFWVNHYQGEALLNVDLPSPRKFRVAHVLTALGVPLHRIATGESFHVVSKSDFGRVVTGQVPITA